VVTTLEYIIPMRLVKQTKWEDFLEGYHNFMYAWDSYNTPEFWEALCYGWYDEYIYPYDDPFLIHIPSPERKLRLSE
jgi:hypothetical protein